MTIRSLRNKLNEQKNKVGLVGGTVEVEEYDEMAHPVAASIDPKGWYINVSIRKGFNPIQDEMQIAYAEAKGIEDGLETLISHVGGLHEPAHWELPVDSGRGCPYDEYNHDKISEAVKQALPSNKKGQAGYVTNAFEDTLINPRCKEFNGDFSGQVLFWDQEGLNCKEKGKEAYTPVYEAFVKLNMCLWGDLTDATFLSRHYTDDEKVNSVVQNIISDLNLQIPTTNTHYLFNKNQWPEMARKFAKNIADLLEDQPPMERLSAFDSGEGSGNG